jgi:hypothetical protein
VPIDLWKEIQSEKETAYLLKSEVMKGRLLEAKNRKKALRIIQLIKEVQRNPFTGGLKPVKKKMNAFNSFYCLLFVLSFDTFIVSFYQALLK